MEILAVDSNQGEVMLKVWPMEERPREKLLRYGADSLSDAELLAIFLRTGVQGCNVVDLARNLLDDFGSISAIFAADVDEFCQAHGLGTAKYVQLQASLEMSKRYLFESISRDTCLTSSQMTKQYLLSEMKAHTREVFALLLLNNQHQVINFEPIFWGTIDSAAVYPRVVVETVIKANAAAVILCHNHPSGVAEPSLADQQITERIKQALELIDVRVLDHMIVAGNQCYSFTEHGLL